MIVNIRASTNTHLAVLHKEAIDDLMVSCKKFNRKVMMYAN